MKYKEFLQTIETEIKKKLEDGYSLKIHPVKKNNGKIYDGLLIINPSFNIAPAIYLNPYYHWYLDGVSINDIVDSIISSYKEVLPKQNFDITSVYDYSLAKSHIIMKLVNYEQNKNELMSMPHVKYLDLAVIFLYYIDSAGSELCTLKITNALLEEWKISMRQLMEDAITNTEKKLPYSLINMEDVVPVSRELINSSGIDPMMLIFTNQYKIYGATTMLYPGILKKISDKLDSDLVLIPSSIHEFLVLPRTIHDDIPTLNSFINEVNSTEVTDEEILSDHVYIYSRKKQAVEY